MFDTEWVVLCGCNNFLNIPYPPPPPPPTMTTALRPCELLRTGTVTVAVLHLSCKVFDHFKTITSLDCPDITSVLQRCLVLSKVSIEYGRILDSLKKEKKQNEYQA